MATALGLLLGLSSFTFQYGEGLSYLSKDPTACMNCHIMKPQFDSWQKASHHTFATCVDCHLPHDFFGKYLAKAENGWNHSRAFTLQNFHEPIQINDKNRLILQQNCLECHGDLVHNLVSGNVDHKSAFLQQFHGHLLIELVVLHLEELEAEQVARNRPIAWDCSTRQNAPRISPSASEKRRYFPG